MNPLQTTKSEKLWKITMDEENPKLGFSIHSGHIAREMWPQREKESSKRKLFLHNKYNGHYFFSSNTTRKEEGGKEKESQSCNWQRELFCNYKRQTNRDTHKYMM